jgi:hypothetical protein
LTEGSVSTVVSVSRPYSEGEFDAAQTQLETSKNLVVLAGL